MSNKITCNQYLIYNIHILKHQLLTVKVFNLLFIFRFKSTHIFIKFLSGESSINILYPCYMYLNFDIFLGFIIYIIVWCIHIFDFLNVCKHLIHLATSIDSDLYVWSHLQMGRSQGFEVSSTKVKFQFIVNENIDRNVLLEQFKFHVHVLKCS